MRLSFFAVLPAAAVLCACDPDAASSPSDPLESDRLSGGSVEPSGSENATSAGGAGSTSTSDGGAGPGAGAGGPGPGPGGSGPGPGGTGGDGDGGDTGSVTVGAGGEGACDGGGASLVLGAATRTLIRGTIVTPAGPIEGEILVVGDTIECVAASCAADPDADGATILETPGYVFPGLIDGHNHILFDVFDEDDWSPSQTYMNHNQWTQEVAYKAVVDAKQYLNGQEGSPVNLGCELDKYGEMKALIAGTTGVLASPGANNSCYGSLSRTIGDQPDLGYDRIQISTLGVPDDSGVDAVCANFLDGDTDAYVIHVAEGIDQPARNEWTDLSTSGDADPGCLIAHQTTIVHGTALQTAQLTIMGDEGMSLIWSPKSNVFLYGGGTDTSKTTDIPQALAQGINVGLGPDWSLGGSVNMLDELRYANFVDDQEFGNMLSPRDLFEMATINNARAFAIDADVGSLEVGKRADLFVLRRVEEDAYDALLGAVPRDMTLVMVNGQALYGDAALQPLGPAGNECESLDICCADKFACIAETGGAAQRLDQTFAEFKGILEDALTAYQGGAFMPLAPIVQCGGD